MRSTTVRSAPRPRSLPVCAAFGILLTAVGGCANSFGPTDGGNPPAGDFGTHDGAVADLGRDGSVPFDFGVLPDLGIPADRDTDGDGLCDVREIVLGANIREADTDGDELPDYFELLAGTRALDPSSPTPDELLFLTETVGASTSAGLRRSVSGFGEDFSGAFVALPVSDPEALSGDTFYVRSFATSANPMGNVAIVAPELERYFGVVGSTELGFEIELTVPAGFLPRGCGRVYPLRYDIKRSDGQLVGSNRRFLVLLPAAGSFADGPWCIPAGCI